MKILDKMHDGVAARAARDAVPIACDCGTEFAWPMRTSGPKKAVVCPSCGATAEMELTQSPEVAAKIATAQQEASK